MSAPVEGLAALREDVERLLAAALDAERRHAEALERADEAHAAELARRDELHVSETSRRDELHVSETSRREALHLDELARRDDVQATEREHFQHALESRDLIGQAKGIVMATMLCSADEAFAILREQSQHENVKIVDIAREITRRTGERAAADAASNPRSRPAS